jgi:hypothetical protein
MQSKTQRFRSTLGGGELIRRDEIPQHPEPFSSGKRLRQKFDLLLRKLGLAQEDTGDVAAGFRKALHITARNRIIVVGHEHDRDRAARPHAGLQQRLRPQSDQHIRVYADHFDRLVQKLG